jgi:hypothetical protein
MKMKILYIIFAVAAVAVAAFVLSRGFQASTGPGNAGTTPSTQEPSGDSAAIESSISAIYPNSTINTIFRESCPENNGKPCWSISISGVGDVVASGGSAGVPLEIIQAPPDIWCNYSYIESLTSGDISYFNIGCSNPYPKCDQSSLCRECRSAADCLSYTQGMFTTGTSNQLLSWYSYDAISTDIKANYVDLGNSSKCQVSRGGIEVFVDFMNFTECQDQIMAYIGCSGGDCVAL